MRIRWKGFELPTRVILDEKVSNDVYGKFIVEPFERGYGITIGNSLRRILLSSLEGTAPVSLTIAGAQHEFASIEGIYEDVINIALNVKSLLVQFDGEGPETIRVEKKGKGPVYAKDFACTNGVKVVNPELLICNIEGENTIFKAEVEIRKGRGFKSSEEFPWKTGDSIGKIWLDAGFSPVRRARWRVEETRVGKITDYDRLILEIWTDGTVLPEAALVEAATILRKHMHPFVKFAEIGQETEQDEVSQPVESAEQEEEAPQIDRELADKLALPVSALDPSVRAANCLANEGIRTLRDLVSRQESEMLVIRNFGKTTLKEIKIKMLEFGIRFGMNVGQ